MSKNESSKHEKRPSREFINNEPNIKNDVKIHLYQELRNNNSIWFANAKTSKSGSTAQSLNSGFNELDAVLHNNGWPAFGTLEFGLNQYGIGELRLLAPTLRELLKQHPNKYIILINPPYLPYSPALVRENLDPAKVLLVQTRSIQDALWSCEQALQSGSCAAVLAWTHDHNLSHKESRRLQLASKSRQTWHILFRGSHCLKQASAASLRAKLSSNRFGQLKLHILKQPNGWGGQQCVLSLHPHYENWQRIPVALLPVSNSRRVPPMPLKIPEFNDKHLQQGNVTVLTSLATLNSVH